MELLPQRRRRPSTGGSLQLAKAVCCGGPTDDGSAPRRRVGRPDPGSADWRAPAGSRTVLPGPESDTTERDPGAASVRHQRSGQRADRRTVAAMRPAIWRATGSSTPSRFWPIGRRRIDSSIHSNSVHESRSKTMTLPAAGSIGARGALPGSHLPFPRVVSRPAVACDIDHTIPFNHAGSGGRRTNCVREPQMSLSPTSSAQNIRRLDRQATGRWHRHLDFALRTNLSNRASRGRSLPATSLRATIRREAKPRQATQRTNCPGAQAQP